MVSTSSFLLNMDDHFYRISAREGGEHKEVEESNFALATPPTFRRHQLLLLRGSSLFPAVIFITIIFSLSPSPASLRSSPPQSRFFVLLFPISFLAPVVAAVVIPRAEEGERYSKFVDGSKKKKGGGGEEEDRWGI